MLSNSVPRYAGYPAGTTHVMVKAMTKASLVERVQTAHVLMMITSGLPPTYIEQSKGIAYIALIFTCQLKASAR